MIVTYNWLKEFVDIEKSPEEIAELLTNSGNEVEEIIYQDRYLKNVVVGKIVAIEQHPNADKLDVCKVDIGEMIQIVTSAKNIKVGDKVPVSLPGADLANGIHIEKSSLRGVESIGMFCSVEELGVTDYDGEVNGIMILDDDAVVGTGSDPELNDEDQGIKKVEWKTLDEVPERDRAWLYWRGLLDVPGFKEMAWKWKEEISWPGSQNN